MILMLRFFHKKLESVINAIVCLRAAHLVDFENKDNWSEQFDWAMDVALKMKKTFKKYL